METISKDTHKVLNPGSKIEINGSYYQRILVSTPKSLMLQGERIGFKKNFTFANIIRSYSISRSSAIRNGVVKRDWILGMGKH